MTKFIAFTGGGTGGHVIPGLAVMEALQEKYSGSLYWIGSRNGIERALLARSAPECTYIPIPTGKLRRYFSLRNVVDVFRVVAGILASIAILVRRRPEVLFSKGGFVSVPPVIAARILRVPVITHESDVDPGLATRINARFATKICVPYPATKELLPERIRARTYVTGNPVRRDLQNADPDTIRKEFGFDSDKPLLFIFGGSLGSERINHMVDSIIDQLLETACVVHQRGSTAGEWARRTGYAAAPFFYEEYPAILAAADLAVCRAGAGTLWELAATRTPAICVPLSRGASRGDQIRNARVFSDYGTVRVLQEEDTDAADLSREIVSLIRDPERLSQMAASCAAVSQQNADTVIADMILSLRPDVAVPAGTPHP